MSNRRMKMRNAVLALTLVLVILSIPAAVYAQDCLQNTRLNQKSTLTTPDIYISETRTIAPYISINKVYTEGSFSYLFFEKSGDKYDLKTRGTKKVAAISTGVTLPSGMAINKGYCQIRLSVNASEYKDCRTDMSINFLRCSY